MLLRLARKGGHHMPSMDNAQPTRAELAFYAEIIQRCEAMDESQLERLIQILDTTRKESDQHAIYQNCSHHHSAS